MDNVEERLLELCIIRGDLYWRVKKVRYACEISLESHYIVVAINVSFWGHDWVGNTSMTRCPAPSFRIGLGGEKGFLF